MGTVKRSPNMAMRPEARELFDVVSKADLFDAAMHLAALATDSYDAALGNGRGIGALVRLARELHTLAEQDIIPRRVGRLPGVRLVAALDGEPS